MRRFLIDTDTASDDAVAIVMAHRWPDVHVEAVTLVSGNVAVEQGAKNALYTIQMCGAQTPVYIGCAKPMIRPAEYATWFHGEDGMGNMHYPDPIRQPETKHAVDVIIETIKAYPGEITLVTLAPLTNIAAALIRAPEIAGMVSRCVIMGGAANVVGNVTPAAEYNIWVDPEAAKIVFDSGMPMEMVGWELSRFEAALTPVEMDEVRGFGNDLARFSMDCNQKALQVCIDLQKATGVTLADPVAMAVALDPKHVVTRQGRYFVDVEIKSELMLGHTLVDELSILQKPPNMTVIWSIDVSLWKQHLYQCLR